MMHEPSLPLVHPLSRGQRALWLLERLAPESGAYRIAAAGRVVAGLDREALERSLARVVARHDALRTVFVEVAGEPVRVLAEVTVPVEEIAAEAWTREELEGRMADAAHRPFDLERGPLLRVVLFRRGPGEDRLVFAVHHLVADLWSLALFLSELGELLAGLKPAESSAGYYEFVAAQEEYLAGEAAEADWRYWQGVLGQRPPPVDLPSDRPRPPVQAFRGAARRLRVPAETWSRLRRLGRSRRSTPVVVLLAAFDALVHRYTGQEDVTVGTPTAGRRSGRLSGVVGYCVNPVPVRADLSGDPSFEQAIDRLREAALGAFEHQDLPFPVLVERLDRIDREGGGERDPSRSPVFQVMLGLQRARLGVDAGMAGFALGVPGATLRLGPLEIESVALEPRGSQFDLTVMTGEVDGELRGTLTYNADLYDATTVERWARQLERLLVEAAEHAERRLSELAPLAPAERAQLLLEWNDTAPAERDPEIEAPATLAEAFRRAAGASPDRVALVAGDRTLSYGALAARAAAVAARLRPLGVGPETRVGVMLPRRAELVVALLGVLEAGGAYVPLDPAYPTERLGFMLADSGAVALLAEPELAARLDLAALDPRPVVLGPDGRTPGGGEPGVAGAPAAAGPGAAAPSEAGNLAYLIYTSGSTGRPKAVAIEHRSALALVRWSEGVFEERELAGVLASTSVCFDLSVFELFVTLSRGGRVFLAENALALADLGPAAAVALINTVPSAMEELARLGWLPPSVETVNLAGEPLRRALVDTVYRRSTARRVLDLYGPSEDTTYSTGSLCAPPAGAGEPAPGEPTIGRPILGTTAYLARDLRPVPLGVAGELLLGGDGLARGYLGRPALTAERFVPDPFAGRGATPGARLYRTGDLARFDRAGELRYLGRIDHQVKIRGHRVELGEIEALLVRHPEVREAVVVARDGSGKSGARLVAYVGTEEAVGAGGAAEAAGRLKAHLEDQLPAPLMPSAVVVLGALPKTPNGKVDRKALPEPDWSARARHVEPRTPTEEALAEIFREVLGIERVGVEDGFFELGGHSLLVARVIAAVQDRLGFELSLSLLFENPTIARLAAALEAAGVAAPKRGRAAGPRAAGTADAERSVHPPSLAQERLWILAQLDPASPAYNLTGGVRLTGRLQTAAFAAAIAGIAARHDSLRTVFRAEASGPVQVVAPPGWPPVRRLPVIDLSALPAAVAGRAADELARREAARPFDLRTGPLLRVTLIRLSSDEHRAIVNLHHIVADGWSIEVFVRELSAHYGARLGGVPPSVPVLPVQYAELARRQREALAGGELDRIAEWWREELDGAPGFLDLPADRPRPPVQTSTVAELRRHLPARLRAAVAEVARELDATPFMIWASALALLLGRLAGQDELILGSPTAGRHRAETHGLIGFFVNTLVLRVEMAGDPSFRELVARVRTRALRSYVHQELPFERLVEALAPRRDRATTPLFQVLFALQNVPREAIELPGLALERIDMPAPAAKFDLTVELEERGEDGLAARFELNRDLFDPETVAGWADAFERLVEAAVAEPDRRLSELAALVPGGREMTSPGPEARLGDGGSERPSGAAGAAAARAAFVAPRTPLEEAVAAIFRDLLGLDRVGVDDRFFELGGHSLLAARLIVEVRDRLGHDLPLAQVFERPTVAGLAAALGERGAAGPVAIPRLPGDGPWPLSFAQERLWFLERMEPGRPTYNMPAAVALRGRLDRGALAAALAGVVRRHPALRTVIEGAGEEPAQRALPLAAPVARAASRLPRVDLAGLPAPRRPAAARALAAREARRPFDLERGPLFRARLVRLAADDHLFVVNVHHAVCDGWSLGIFVRELAALYRTALTARDRTALAGGGDPLPEPPIRYGDFAAWQRGRLSGDRLAELVAWWRSELAGLPQLSELPLDRPRPPAPTRAGVILRRRLPAERLQPFARLTREHGSTLFMALFAAFQTLVHRHSGATDLAVGTPVAGRERPETAGVIGLFVDTVVLRSDLADDPPFVELLDRARRRTVAALAHQALPFDRLVAELVPRRESSIPPIFQVMLALQNAPLGTLDLPGVSMESVDLDAGSSKFDLSASFRESGDDLVGSWAYALELFDATTVARLASRFEVLIGSIAADPERRVSELPLLSPAERHQVRVEWRSPSERYEAGEAIHRMLAARADEAPDAVALVMEGRALSLGALRRRWTEVAARLRAAGVGPGNLVALFLDRSFDLVAGLVGILETGAAYVPVDPAYPADRVAFMLADSDARAVVTRPDLAAGLAGSLPAADGGGPRVVVLGGEDGPSGSASAPAPPVEAAPIDPLQAAYVIYTSGSTGRPKGVVVGHRSLANRVAFHASEMKPGDRFLARTTISFDVAILQLVVPILAGGGAVLVPPTLEQDPAALARLIERGRATHVSVPPSLLTQLLAEPAFVRLRCLEHVFTGGEVVPPALADQFTSTFDVPLINRYGPTELTISITSWTCPPDFREPTLPIGRPIARAEVYLLDRELRPVPAGVTGELHGGGVAVARGYLGRPAATAAAFVPEPFSGVPGARLYRTGDLARWRPDGEIEFVGRRDEQVKVRGYRIELGEVESALGRCPGIAEAVVVALPEPSTGSRQLVAYLVPAPGAGAPAEVVAAAREHVAARLPAYMVPSAFAVLDGLPQTPSGKVDRRALPQPDWQHGAGAEYEAPRTPVEEVVAALYAGVLGLDRAAGEATGEPARRVGARDDFFDLGGHSLLATRLVSRVRENLGVELPIRALFENPTVAGLAAAIEEASRGGEAPPPLVPLPRPNGNAERSFEPSFAQERLWFLAQLDPGSPAYHLPGVVRMRGRLDPAALAAAVAAVGDRHEALRTVFRAEGARPAQVVLPRGWQALGRLPVIDLSRLPPSARAARERAAARAVQAETARPFDLEAGPLLRATLLRLAPDDHVLVVNTHHIVSDGWSVGVFVRELSALYAARVEGGGKGPSQDAPPALAELPIQYADYAAWQRAWLDGAALGRIADWWRGELAGAPGTLELPTDRPRPPVQTFRGGEVRRSYGGALGGAVGRLARDLGATPFMVWLAAVGVLLSRLSGQDDLVVGSPIAGRGRGETEGLIGFFVNTLALRVDLGGDPTFAELIARVRERALGAYAHQDLPFERLVEAIAPRRDLATTPVFQVLFALQNVPRERIELPGLALERVELPAPAAKFDLTVELSERGAGEVAGRFELNRDLFDLATVSRWAGSLERLASAAVSEPERRLAELPLLARAERHQLVHEVNDTRDGGAEAPPEDLATPLHRRIRARAAEVPDRVALVFEDACLSFAELERRAGRLARELRRGGVGPDSRVGVAAERSLELVVALVAVLEAGAAYVPFDPSYPPERLEFMLADADLSCLLVQGRLLARLPAVPREVPVIDLDAPPEPGPGEPAEDADGDAGPESAAYTIYTSGSTGRPKGAVNSHRAIVNRLVWMQRAFGLGPDDRVLQKTPASFDVSVWEFFWPLSTGACLVVARPDGHRDPAYLARTVERERITTLHFVPSMLQAFLSEPDLSGCAGVRRTITSGEALPRELAERFFERLPAPVELHNLYGPTEAAVDVTWWPCERGSERRSIPIGRPIANVSIHVADAGLRPVPLGVPGEVEIGGVNLARGYLRRPGLTAGRFVPDPFGGIGGRLYRTGDLGRRLPAGEVEFLGRLDHQVKVRGVRIELGEVESRLLEHPRVREAAVVARHDRGGDTLLVAYVAPAADAPDPSELREHLRRTLPDAMVPAAFVALESLPVNPSGKTDRRVLAGRADGGAERRGPAAEPPETPVELALAAAFAEVLGLAGGAEAVGVHDDFFELGGHSLKATQVLLRVHDAFGVRVPVRKFFEGPTVASLAVAVAEQLLESVELDEETAALLLDG